MKILVCTAFVVLLITGCSEKAKKAEVLDKKPLSLDLGDGRSVNAVAFSPDGKLLITGGENRKIKLVQVADGTITWISDEQPDAVLSVDISPDARYFAATCGDNTQQTAQIVVYDMDSKKEIWSRKNLVNNVQLVRFSPDGKYTFVANHFHITIFETATGKQLHYFSGHAPDVVAPSGHVDAVTSFAFTEDPDNFISVGWDKNVKVWDLKTGREIKNFPEADPINGCFLKERDNLVVTMGAGGIHVWNRTSARVEQTVEHNAEIKGFASAGEHFVTIDEAMAITVWNRSNFTKVNSITGAHDLGIWGIAGSSDGTLIATTGGAGIVTVWPIESLLIPQKASQ